MSKPTKHSRRALFSGLRRLAARSAAIEPATKPTVEGEPTASLTRMPKAKVATFLRTIEANHQNRTARSKK